MAQLEVHPQKLEKFHLQVDEEIRHIQRMLQLVEECRKYDTMHQELLQEVSRRLQSIHMDLVQLQEINQSLLVRTTWMDQELKDQLETQQKKISQIFE